MKKRNSNEYKQALVYCRVSSERQVKEGTGLDSQEQRCLKYAAEKCWSVAEIFRDEGISGGLFERPAMQKLIEYLDMHPNEKYVIIFDDLKRFARDIEVHIRLKRELTSRDAKLECLNFNIEDAPEGHFVEAIIALTGQLEREQNKRQVIQKQMARLESGFWSFHAPTGLKFIKDPTKGKILVPDEPLASIYKDAIEQFINYKLSTLEQVKAYILDLYRIHNISRPLSLNGVSHILTNPLYAGLIVYEPWDIPLKKGQHTGFIEPEMYYAVKAKLSKSARPRLRKDYKADFPRNFVLCAKCHKPMTGSWHKGRSGIRYPHYWCKTQGCEMKNKTFKREEIEKTFNKLVKKIEPTKEILDLSLEILKDLWADKSKSAYKVKSGASAELRSIDDKIQIFIKRISEASTSAVITHYEAEIEKLSNRKISLENEVAREQYTEKQFIEAAEFVFEKLKNPLEQWTSQNYFDQRLFLHLYFEKGLIYDPEKGFKETELPVIIELAQRKNSSKIESMVEMAGVKPASKKDRPKNSSQA